MEDREIPYVNEYHQRLIAISQQAHLLRQAKPTRPGWRDYVLLHFGGYLITLGQRLRSASMYPYEKPVEIAQDCA